MLKINYELSIFKHRISCVYTKYLCGSQGWKIDPGPRWRPASALTVVAFNGNRVTLECQRINTDIHPHKHIQNTTSDYITIYLTFIAIHRTNATFAY